MIPFSEPGPKASDGPGAIPTGPRAPTEGHPDAVITPPHVGTVTLVGPDTLKVAVAAGLVTVFPEGPCMV